MGRLAKSCISATQLQARPMTRAFVPPTVPARPPPAGPLRPPASQPEWACRGV